MTPTAGLTVAPGATIFQANGVQSSIYIVYLKGIGLTGTSTDTLFAAIEITSCLGSLFAGRGDAARRPATHDAERHRVVDPALFNPAGARWYALGVISCPKITQRPSTTRCAFTSL